MKRLLGMFSTLGLTVSTISMFSNVIACSSIELPTFPVSKNEAIALAQAHQLNANRIDNELDQTLHYEANTSKAKKDENYQAWLIEVFWSNAYITIYNVYLGYNASSEVSELKESNNSFSNWCASSTLSANKKIVKWVEEDIYSI